MKKNKKKGAGQPVKMSAERYMKERVRNLPMGKCYITPDWEESGLAHIVITRERAGGQLVYVSLLLDTLCLGVKDAEYAIDFTPEELQDALEHFRKSHPLEETEYEKVHNLIHGAIEFAEEGGIRPVKEWGPASYILEEDTDDIPLIEYEYGKDGKHLLVIGPDGRERKHLQTLLDNLEEDEFAWVDLGENHDDIDSEGMRDFMEEKERHPVEKYSYNYPEYPAEPIVKHQFIADALLNSANYEELPRDVIKRIFALPDDEAATDICNIALYTIGKTYSGIEDFSIGEPEEGSLLHTVILLTHIQSEKGLSALLEIARQSEDFLEYHFGDLGFELIPTALATSASENPTALETILYEPGLASNNRSMATEALTILANLYPEKKEEVIEIFRRLLVSMKERLPKTEGCDASFAGFVMSHVIDLEANQLIPEVKEIFATDCVDKSIAGDCDEVVSQIEHNQYPRHYELPTIHEQYEHVKTFGEAPNP